MRLNPFSTTTTKNGLTETIEFTKQEQFEEFSSSVGK